MTNDEAARVSLLGLPEYCLETSHLIPQFVAFNFSICCVVLWKSYLISQYFRSGAVKCIIISPLSMHHPFEPKTGEKGARMLQDRPKKFPLFNHNNGVME